MTPAAQGALRFARYGRDQGCELTSSRAIGWGSMESSLAKITSDNRLSGIQALKELKPELWPE